MCLVSRICLVRVLVLHDLHFVLFLSGLFSFTFISPRFISQRILLYTVVILLSCFYICAIGTYLLFYTLLRFSVPSPFITPFVSVFLLHILFVYNHFMSVFPIHLCFQLRVLPKLFHIPSNGSLKGCLIALVGLLTLRLPSLGWVLTRLLHHFYLTH